MNIIIGITNHLFVSTKSIKNNNDIINSLYTICGKISKTFDFTYLIPNDMLKVCF